jgi:hypothetical protein
VDNWLVFPLLEAQLFASTIKEERIWRLKKIRLLAIHSMEQELNKKKFVNQS